MDDDFNFDADNDDEFGDGDFGFGDSSDDGFGFEDSDNSSSSSGSDDLGFGDSSNGDSGSGGYVDTSMLGNDSSSDYSSNDDYQAGGKSKAIIIAVIGLIVIIIVAIIGNFAFRSKKKADINNTGNYYDVNSIQGATSVAVNNPVEYSNESVSMPQRVDQGATNVPVQTTVVETKVIDKADGWKEIEAESIEFTEDLSGDFTVTAIKHYVRNTKLNEMEMKTEVTGSISGLTGTYIIEVPYTIGSALKVGNTFSVNYKIGNFGDNTLVSDITY